MQEGRRKGGIKDYIYNFELNKGWMVLGRGKTGRSTGLEGKSEWFSSSCVKSEMPFRHPSSQVKWAISYALRVQ